MADRNEIYNTTDKGSSIKMTTVYKIGRIALGALILIVSFFLLSRFLINRSFLTAYAEGNYEYDQEKKLLTMNAPEGYLPHYNMGNAAYEEGDYDSAVIFYERALSNYIPKGKECDIRVNLALSLIARIDFDHLNTDERINDAIEELQKARNVLTEVGCADPDGTDGHDPEAEQLKQDIDRMIEQLKNRSSGDSGSQSEEQQQPDTGKDKQDQPKGQDNEQSKREKRLQEELQKRREDSTINRSEQHKSMEEWGSYGNSGSEGDEETYQGKQW